MGSIRVAVLVLALSASVVSAPVAAASNGRGHGLSIPSLPGQAASAPGHSVKPAGVPGSAASVAPGSPSSGGPLLIVPAPPSASGTLPAAPAIRLPAAAAPVAPPRSSGPVAATPSGAMSEAVPVKPSAMNNQPTVLSGAPGNHPVRDSVSDTVKSERMLPAGHRAELVDPSNPALRVEVTAPADRALDINALLGESRHSGIFAGLSRGSRTANAVRATVLHDGRIVLVSERALGAGKSADRAHPGHADFRHDKHVRVAENSGSPQLRPKNSRDGEELAPDGGASSRQAQSSVPATDPAASTSLTARRVSTQESADEDSGLKTIMRPVDDQHPRMCS